MSGRHARALRAAVVGVATLSACTRQPPTATTEGEASAAREQSVRVPAALSLSRGLDTLSVSIDPASLADTSVTVDPGMLLGIESDTVVFPVGHEPPAAGRKGYASGTNFSLGTSTWNTRSDGVPLPGTRYVAEMQLVLFETDVPPQHAWDPHSGRYKVLWTRTLRQAEE